MGQGSMPRYVMICSIREDILLAIPPLPRNTAGSGELPDPDWQAAMETSDAMADIGLCA